LGDCGFLMRSCDAALFFPPSPLPFVLRSARTLERVGRAWAPARFGGVLMIAAQRRDTAAPRRGLAVRDRQPVRVLGGVPQGGALPAWRDGGGQG